MLRHDNIYCLLSELQDNVTAGINGLLQSLRLWTRVTELLTRLHETSISTSDMLLHSPNPFEVSETPTSNLKSESGKLNAMHWKAAEVWDLILSWINVSNCSS